MEKWMEKVANLTIEHTTERIKQKLRDYDSYHIREERPIESLEVSHEVCGDYIFFIGHLTFKGSRMSSYCMSMMGIGGIDEYYSSMNVIDTDKMYTIEDVKRNAKIYFNSISNELNQIIAQ